MATYIKKRFDLEIYDTWWFIACWLLFVGTMVWTIIKNYRRNLLSTFLHFSFLLILIGAMFTFFTGEKGSVHLRMGKPAGVFLENNSEECYPLPFALTLNQFTIKKYPGTQLPMDYVSNITVRDGSAKQTAVISMNRIFCYKNFRFMQGSFDNDMQGVTLAVNHDPWGIALVYGGYFVIVLCMFYQLISYNGKFRLFIRQLKPDRRLVVSVLVMLAVAVILLPVYVLSRIDSHSELLQPVLLSPWLKPHVWCITASYGLFSIMAFIAFLALLIHTKRAPELEERLSVISLVLLYPAVFLLALGICMGSVWANDSWGSYWSWDPKETWALITFLVYSIPLHNDKIAGLQQPVRYHLYIFIAFISVVMTYVGVNQWLGGVHSYGG